ncbi:MAG TPA: sulfite exporter TauE/SafE family protein [Deltaproteobacteria bacterium]|nr:sulfite exporter TauE/SafE family protein [Deltaproteobacteria bacterium]
MKINAISFIIGLFAGIFGGLVGIGGGIIMIPLMILFLKLSQHKAHGTSLLALVFTGLSGAIIYSLHGSVDIYAAAALALPAVFTIRLGVYYAHSLAEWKLRKAFGIFLFFCAVMLFLKPYMGNAIVVSSPASIIIIFVIAGAATGFLSGMMGVGGGIIMVPVMVLLAGFGQHLAQGTALLVMVPAGAVGAYTNWRLGNVNNKILYGLVTGILLGTYSGGYLAHLIAEDILRLIFVTIMIVLSFRYIKTGDPEEVE